MFCPWWKWPNWMWNCCKNKHLELERQKPEPVLNGFSDPLFKWWVLESGGEFLIQLFCILCFKLGFPRSLVTQIGCGISHETCKAVEAMSPHRLQRLRSQKNLRHAMSTFPWRFRDGGRDGWKQPLWLHGDCLFRCTTFHQQTFPSRRKRELSNKLPRCVCHGYSDGCTNSNGSDVGSIEENLLLDVRIKIFGLAQKKSSFPSFHLC